MAGPQVGYAGKVQVAPDSSNAPGTFVDVNGSSKASCNPKVAALSSTAFNPGGYEGRVAGLIDADATVEFFYIANDAGQQQFLTSMLARQRVWVKVYRDATHYSQASFIVTSFPNEAEPGAVEKVAVGLAFDGTPASPLTAA